MGTQMSIREKDIEKGIEEANQVKILAKTERFSSFKRNKKKVFPIKGKKYNYNDLRNSCKKIQEKDCSKKFKRKRAQGECLGIGSR